MKVPSVRLPAAAAPGPAGERTSQPPRGPLTPASPAAGRPRGPIGYFRSLFSGERSLSGLLWIDMLAVATGISLAVSALALFLYALGVPAWLSLGLWALPIPYGLTVFSAVWIAAGREPDPARRWTARFIALCWLPLFVVI